MLYSDHDYLANPFLATEKLGVLLRTGSVRLFLGAGVSSGFGLPEWRALIVRILGREGDTDFAASLATKSEKELAALIDEVDNGSLEYVRLVQQALYRDVAADLLKQLQGSPLLLAVAALVTGVCRGRIDSIVTYNYDNLLEQYLAMLGYAVCVRIRPDQLSTRAEVEISHPHGWIPQDWDGVSPLEGPLLSEKSYRARRADIDEGWSALMEHGLMSKVGFFLGMSGDDGAVLDILKRTQKRVKRIEDYLGYWLLEPKAFGRNACAIRDVGMCPIRLEKENVPIFVLRICQVAARA